MLFEQTAGGGRSEQCCEGCGQCGRIRQQPIATLDNGWHTWWAVARLFEQLAAHKANLKARHYRCGGVERGATFKREEQCVKGTGKGGMVITGVTYANLLVDLLADSDIRAAADCGRDCVASGNALLWYGRGRHGQAVVARLCGQSGNRLLDVVDFEPCCRVGRIALKRGPFA